jgi:hypothetical protein
MSNTLKFGNGEWYGKEGTILAYNDENNNYKPLPFTFDRASSATRVNKDGLIETVGADQPRVDYLNDSNGALLLEPSRSNLIQYSNFDSVWTNSSNFTLNTVISPQGIQNGNTLSKGSAYDASSYVISSGVPSGQTAVFSVFVKKNTTNIVGIRLASGSSASDIRKNINLDTGEITNGLAGNQIGFISLEKEDFGNGWYRLKLKGTTSGNDNVCSLYAGSIGNTTNDGEVYVYGAQLEQGSYPTSYIPTQGSAVTRAAENTTTQDNVPSTVIGQTEGTVYTEFEIYETPTGTHRIIILSDGTANERIGISVGSGILYAFIVDGGSTQCEIVKSSFTGGTYKVAFGYKANDFVLYLNGVQVGTDNSGSVSSCNRIDLGNQFNASQLEGNIIDAKLYNTRLSNAELASLTQV